MKSVEHHGHGLGEDPDEHRSALLQAVSGEGDQGRRVALLGIAANIGLTILKAVAGYVLSSASLVADAGHSLSDLLADLVTLFCWHWSRRPTDRLYPFGYGKYESLGSLGVAFLLVSGGVGIGVHSYNLLLGVISPWIPFLKHTLDSHRSSSDSSHHHPFSHAHGHDHQVDIRASFFALLSILVKEGLYRTTYRVGKETNSNVLVANALHHRSDVWSSFVALLAIVGSWLGIKILDPIGGFTVSAMIVSSGVSIGKRSLEDLLNKSTNLEFNLDIKNLLVDRLKDLQSQKSNQLNLSIDTVRHLRLGPDTLVFLDVLINQETDHPSSIDRSFTSTQWVFVQQMLSRFIFKEKKTVKEVFVKFKFRQPPS